MQVLKDKLHHIGHHHSPKLSHGDKRNGSKQKNKEEKRKGDKGVSISLLVNSSEEQSYNLSPFYRLRLFFNCIPPLFYSTIFILLQKVKVESFPNRNLSKLEGNLKLGAKI